MRKEGRATLPEPKKTSLDQLQILWQQAIFLMRIIQIIINVMKSEGTQNGEGQCQNCREKNTLIQLLCGHHFCVKCLTFAYHKHKNSMNRVSQTKCSRCERTIELAENDLRMINQFTDQVLVPLMREEQQGKNVKTLPNEGSAPSKQFKSHQQSIEKLTPIGGRFYSKCQSPKTGMSQSACPFHPEQQITVLCLTCQNSLLCISCTSSKKHASHILKTLPKGLESVQQQLALSKLKSRENMGVLQVIKRRIEDKKTIIKERWQKAKHTLELHFDNLVDLLSRKREEIMFNCSQLFEKWIEQLMRDENRMEEALKANKRHMQRLIEASKSNGSYVDIIKKSTQLIEEVKTFKQPELQCTDFTGIYDWQGVIRDLDHICEQVEKINPHSTFDFNATAIKASRSEEKLLKENQGKRTKTNMMSLNSSRERREKKYTKTEEDQRRNKSKANYKTQSATKLTKINKAYPAYLVQYLQKNNPLDSFAENNPLTSSFKSTKLLSKSHLPGEEAKRKKEHVALIKQRLERKTFNGNAKEHKHGEGMRKKKIPC